VAAGAQRLDEELRLRRLSGSVESLEAHEHRGVRYGACAPS
jgi:hypothetical protein